MACCSGGTCGANLDREPSLGKCNCAAGKVNSDGFCLDRCSEGLRGKFESTCYTDCPSDSLRFFDWSKSGSNQEYSDYDPTSPIQ